jgi:hypothetical protein
MNSTIQETFRKFYSPYCETYGINVDYDKVANAIMRCKTGALGYNISVCDECGHVEVHNNSCRNRNCPNCQAIPKELWVDARKAEVIDAPYFHVIFTVPSELNPLFLANQKTFYSLFHSSVAKTLKELAANKKYLGASSGSIQVLHTWGQKMDFHPHIHCIVIGGGLTSLQEFKKCSSDFFIPVRVLSKKFRGKFLCHLRKLYEDKKLSIPLDLICLNNSYEWNGYVNSLFQKEWIPFIKETFNGAGNAIEYLGRYTHRIAISNSRILNVTDTHVTFSAKDYRKDKKIEVTLEGVEFIRRFLMHVLPKGFVKIRNYGILSNRMKKKQLKLIRKKLASQEYKSRLAGLKTEELILTLYGVNVNLCPCCQSSNYHLTERYHRRI